MEAETELVRLAGQLAPPAPPGLGPRCTRLRLGRPAAHLLLQVPHNGQVRARDRAAALRLLPLGLQLREQVAGAPEGQPRRGARLAGTWGWQRSGRWTAPRWSR